MLPLRTLTHCEVKKPHTETDQLKLKHSTLGAEKKAPGVRENSLEEGVFKLKYDGQVEVCYTMKEKSHLGNVAKHCRHKKYKNYPSQHFGRWRRVDH